MVMFGGMSKNFWDLWVSFFYEFESRKQKIGPGESISHYFSKISSFSMFDEVLNTPLSYIPIYTISKLQLPFGVLFLNCPGFRVNFVGARQISEVLRI